MGNATLISPVLLTMHSILYRILLALALATASQMVAAAVVDSGHVKAELIAEETAIVPGQPLHVALREVIAPGWHTYWVNPGDSGAPTRLSWKLLKGFVAGEIQWPLPARIPYGPLVNFGYEGEVLFPVTITVPKVLDGGTATIRAHARWLVCADICIPEQTDLALTLPVATRAGRDPVHEADFARARQQVPRDIGAGATVQASGDTLDLTITMPGLGNARLKSAVFFPFEAGQINNAAKQRFRSQGNQLTLSLAKGKQYDPQKSLAGVVKFTEQAGAEQITSGFEVHPSVLPPAAGATTPVFGLGKAILFALLGGLILNLMPCVFPVLSIKVLSLVSHNQAGRDHARLHGWVYLAGVVLSFVAIAGLLLLLRAGGEEIGWGFQLQSPPVVAVLAYLFFLIGLSLSGLFEVGGALMNAGSSLAGRQGVAGSFFTGVLATVVAAPCTAPFMAGAIGYALLLDNLTALAIFAALGVGMAAPYLVLCYAPGLLNKLPRPGAWMDVLKEFLAFPMYASAVWLVWVLSQQAGSFGVLLVLAGGLLLALSAWIWRRAARHPVVRMLAVVLALIAISLPFRLHSAPAVTSGQPTSIARDDNYAGPVAQPWTPERLAELRAKGPVFVNFTAAWCITCKVNDAVALDSAAVRQAFADKHVAYLMGDWTNQDPAITAALAEYGRSGVPLYLLYIPGQPRAQVLPQILTQSTVLQALDAL